ncbi:DUF3034 family protein [Teredinibacter turnerae]|uniref:DUF3034 family protein n=1 Tax=Teredinibacter turnerae TaxID=2426 RepID=UPI000365C0D7|nr:DUF3034 family protein [Teredinibacter turnerae]
MKIPVNTRRAALVSVVIAGLVSSAQAIAGGKLLATPGVSQVEGAGGGGIVPWAQLAGYATENSWSASGFCSRADVTDYQLDVCGLQANFFDRVEVSYARQTFEVPALKTDISQDIISAKIRLYGDIVYSRWPQVSLGVQHKKLLDSAVAYALGADEESGTDFYLAASKLHLAALLGRNVFWNVSVRNTRANQLGLLGFGRRDHTLSTADTFQLEASTALFLSPNWALGYEYRQKPDNLGLGEQAWQDAFIAWFPNKRVNITAAYLDLGSIAGAPEQTGWYVSLMGNL